MTKFTPISEIGEMILIKQLTEKTQIRRDSTLLGVGDDAAVVSCNNKKMLLTTDTLAEGVHFNLMYTPLKHLGYKAIVSSLSDVYAMNGEPSQALVSLAIPNKYSVEMIEKIYEGIHLACNNYNIDLVGGDTTASPHSLAVTVTVIGSAQAKNITYRSGAEANDLLVVSGNLGGAYLGLQILEREKLLFQENSNTQPSLEKYTKILERQLKPEARGDITKELKKINIKPTSMIDISDGLSSEVSHLSKSSNIGFRIFEEKVPISTESVATAQELSLDPLFCALHGGEDYELLFTVPLKDHNKITQIPDLTVIGHTIHSGGDVELLTKNNELMNLSQQSWDSFTSRKENI